MVRLHLIASIAILTVTAVVTPASAEWYVAGMAGGVFPKALSHVKERDFPTFETPAGTKSSDLALSRSIMGGAKVGYFFERWKWFGIEGEVYRYSPNFKQQTVMDVTPTGETTTNIRLGSNHVVT